LVSRPIVHPFTRPVASSSSRSRVHEPSRVVVASVGLRFSFKRLFTVSTARVVSPHLYASSALLKSKTCARKDARKYLASLVVLARVHTVARVVIARRTVTARARNFKIAGRATIGRRVAVVAPARTRSSPRTDARGFFAPHRE
jgi:hypothetical protein